MKFIIREAVSKDCEQVCELSQQALELHSKARPEVFRDQGGTAFFKDYVSAILSDENAVILCAERSGRIIGMAHVLARESPDIPIMVHRRFAVIENVVVREEFRKLGVGTALIAAAHDWALRKGVARVELNVWAFNEEAIKLYKKLGYEVISSRMAKEIGE